MAFCGINRATRGWAGEFVYRIACSSQQDWLERTGAPSRLCNGWSLLMRVQRSTAQHLVTRDSAAVETPPAAESPQDREGWPLGLNVLQKRPLPKRTHRDESERRPHHGDANARVTEAEAVYDIFVVAKYLADPLHGTADETAELINDIPPAANPGTPPKPGNQRIHRPTIHRPTTPGRSPRPITHRHRMATTCHPHRMPHIPHSRTLHMPRMRRRLRGIMGRTPAPGIRRIRMRLGMQRRTASCTRLPRKARRQAHSIWR